MSTVAKKEIERRLKEEGKENPLEFLLSVMHDKTCLKMYRIEAARACLPYVHKKQPVAIGLSGELGLVNSYIPSRDQLMSEDPRFNGENDVDDL